MLQAIGVHKHYGGRQVVQNVDLRLAPGEILGLLGPNGAGKSTTVGLLCGLVEPDQGHITLAGCQTVNERQQRIGLVPQDLALYDDLPAGQNLALFGALYGVQGRVLTERVQAALALVGLTDRAHDKPATFSGGMKRRLNIACALVHDPDVLLLDEPTVGVDPQSRNAIFDNLETLRRRGKALLYTTHYMEEAERLCDRIVIMDHGQVLAEDTLPGLLQRLPAAASLELDLHGEVDVKALQAALALPHASQTGPRLRLGVRSLDADAVRVLSWLQQHGHQVLRISSGRAGLEDVFLQLTGRRLRDSQAPDLAPPVAA